MAGPPTGIVTFLFTDIEGSTALLQHLGDQRYAEVLTAHRDILRAAFQGGGGYEVDTQGDSFLIAFGNVQDAVATAVAAQRAINTHPWPEDAPIRVRMGMHTGEPTVAGCAYVGLDVHRAARIMSAGCGGQILLSQVRGRAQGGDDCVSDRTVPTPTHAPRAPGRARRSLPVGLRETSRKSRNRLATCGMSDEKEKSGHLSIRTHHFCPSVTLPSSRFSASAKKGEICYSMQV